MPSHIRENLPENVIDIINLVKRMKSDAQTNPKFSTQESLEDLETHLCDLLSSMIASPLTGRIFLQAPSAYVPAEVAQSSLRAHLDQD